MDVLLYSASAVNINVYVWTFAAMFYSIYQHPIRSKMNIGYALMFLTIAALHTIRHPQILQFIIATGVMLAYFHIQSFIEDNISTMFPVYNAVTLTGAPSSTPVSNSLPSPSPKIETVGEIIIKNLLNKKTRSEKIQDIINEWPFRNAKLSGYVVSTINGVLCTFFGIYAYVLRNYASTFSDVEFVESDPFHGGTHSNLIYMHSCALGYFLWDLYPSYQQRNVSPLSMIHAVLGSILYTLFSSGYHVYHGAVFLNYEASNLFYNIKQYYDGIYAKREKAASTPFEVKVAGIIFALAFFRARIWFAVEIIIDFISTTLSHITDLSIPIVFIILAGFFIHVLNFAWFRMIYKALHKELYKELGKFKFLCGAIALLVSNALASKLFDLFLRIIF